MKASVEEVDDPLPFFEELLGGAGDAQDPHTATSSLDDGSERANGAVGHPKPPGCDNAPTPEARGGRDKRGGIDERGSTRPNMGDSISKEQGGEHSSLSTRPSLAPGLKARYDPQSL